MKVTTPCPDCGASITLTRKRLRTGHPWSERAAYWGECSCGRKVAISPERLTKR